MHMLNIQVRSYLSVIAVITCDEFRYLTLIQKDTAE